jgi:hypothetical protein
MKWFDNWFRKKCKEAWETRDAEPANPSTYTVGLKAVSANHGLDSHGLSLTIYGADGGTVMEFRHYDSARDRHDHSLHVISQHENFEERVAGAITMEMMRRGLTR